MIEKEVGELLAKHNLTLAVAESCTGGLISHRITNVPGSSKYFEIGIVAYSNDAKVELLKVPKRVLKEHGAVSSQTAIAMAQGVRRVSRADLGLGITGIAGPAGGTEQKPVGLVYIALATERAVGYEEFRFKGERLEIKEKVADEALRILKEHLMRE